MQDLGQTKLMTPQTVQTELVEGWSAGGETRRISSGEENEEEQENRRDLIGWGGTIGTG